MKIQKKEHQLKIQNENSNNWLLTNRAVTYILEKQKEDKKIIGSISQLISVNKKYQKAIEIYSGRNLLNIVVEDDTTAIKYINKLKENKIGQATFLPLSKINVNLNLDEQVLNKNGVIDYVINLVDYEKKI